MVQRVKLVLNPNYKRNGLKSYAYLLTKFSFAPTLEGPFRVASRVTHHESEQHRLGSHHSHHTHEERSRHHHPHGTGGTGGTGGTPSTGTPSTGTQQPGGNSGRVSADDIQNDSEYLAEVSIGTPPQTLRLDFDTGSADLWVWSTELPADTQSQGTTSGHTIFDPSKSSTFKRSTGSTWQITYGDQSSASGDVGTDTLRVGNITVQNQAIELAKVLSAQFQSGAGDGLLGLAWGNINTVKPRAVATPVQNMITQQDIPQNAELFTAYLGSWRDTNDADKGISFYTFGEIDTAVTSQIGQPVYTAVDNSQGFWQFPSTSVTIAGQNVPRSGNTAIADTGTTLLLTDDTILKQIYAKIPGAKYDSNQQGYVFPNNLTADQFPEIIFPCGNTPIKVQPEDLAFADAGNNMVYGGIQSRGDLTFDILGDTWLKGAYVVFDQGNQRIGVVQRTSDPQNLQPPPSAGT